MISNISPFVRNITNGLGKDYPSVYNLSISAVLSDLLNGFNQCFLLQWAGQQWYSCKLNTFPAKQLYCNKYGDDEFRYE